MQALYSPSGGKDSKARGSTHFTTMPRHRKCASLEQWNQNRHNVHRSTVKILQQQPVTISDRTQQWARLPDKLARNVSASVCTNQRLQTSTQTLRQQNPSNNFVNTADWLRHRTLLQILFNFFRSNEAVGPDALPDGNILYRCQWESGSLSSFPSQLCRQCSV